MGIILGLLGLVCIANGLLMLPSVESAMQQTVTAIYIVGGLLVLSSGLILAVLVDVLKQLKASAHPAPAAAPRATEPGQLQPPVTYMERPVAKGGWACRNCGKENSPRIDTCSCGTSR